MRNRKSRKIQRKVDLAWHTQIDVAPMKKARARRWVKTWNSGISRIVSGPVRMVPLSADNTIMIAEASA